MSLPLDMSSPLIWSLDDHSRAMYGRMYSGDMARYEDRLRAIGFVNKDRVLDAGCGFGQWSVALAKLNKRVEAVEINPQRLGVLAQIAAKTEYGRIFPNRSSIDALPLAGGSVNAIFCYSVIYNTDYVATLKEFYRVLKPGGALYLGTNGPGWYLYNLIRSHNPALNFNPRSYAIKAFTATAAHKLTGKFRAGDVLVMSPAETVRRMREMGFKDIRTGGDGRINPAQVSGIKPFYAERYMGIANVFEILAYK